MALAIEGTSCASFLAIAMLLSMRQGVLIVTQVKLWDRGVLGVKELLSSWWSRLVWRLQLSGSWWCSGGFRWLPGRSASRFLERLRRVASDFVVVLSSSSLADLCGLLLLGFNFAVFVAIAALRFGSYATGTVHLPGNLGPRGSSKPVVIAQGMNRVNGELGSRGAMNYGLVSNGQNAIGHGLNYGAVMDSPNQLGNGASGIDVLKNGLNKMTENEAPHKTFATAATSSTVLPAASVIMKKGNYISVWIRILNLNWVSWHPQILSNLACGVGVLLKFDHSTLLGDFGHFARILVDVDMASFLSDMLTLGVHGYCHEICMVYEKLPAYCTTCNNIGYLLANCHLFKRESDIKAADHSECKEKPMKLVYVPNPSDQDNTNKAQSQQFPENPKEASLGKESYAELVLEKKDKGKSKVTWVDCMDHEIDNFNVEISKGSEINMANLSIDDYNKQEMDLVNLLPNH
ncbi:hypothetical protein FNV43_RR08187 [Rhamnella rubrinervis]|uniref:Uncharacterized protein n=1 Tax=Rhamnella rubrinervis TaxID=2594499 RepID=A0A8K0MMV2_9ROSA|nr:hypothetical protein FNV43_RR08187 [Rhamnella rubrinervis]